MGTRGFIGFVAAEKETIVYNHWDSYPSGVGLSVLRFAHRVGDGEKRAAAKLVHVTNRVPPTLEEIEKLLQYRDVNVSDQDLSDWYCLLRNTQGYPARILEAGYAEHAPEWPLDSLFCEWGYLIDFDNNTFEVYEGFQERPPLQGRWAGKSPAPRYEGDSVEYHAVEQVAVFSLHDLPTEETFLLLEGDE